MKSNALTPNHRILIIDDNPSIHADFRGILCPAPANAAASELEALLFDESQPEAETARFELDSAHQGEEGLQMVEKSLAEGRPYAMAFVDVRMPPGWDGIETIARIWKICPELQVVVCTAYSDYSWDEMRAKVGQPDSLLVLKKPFDNVEVQQMAHALTKKWLLNLQARLQVAELEEANKSLALSEERFSKAFRESPLGSALQNLEDGRFVDVNQMLAETAGRSREEMIGKTPEELQLWENPSPLEKWREAVGRNEMLRNLEARMRTKAGTFREMRVSMSPIAVGGHPHLLILSQDVSEQALLERQFRQAQKMDAIGKLAAGVAHDFNNILTVIQGHAGMIQNMPGASEPQQKSLDQINRSSARAAKLIRQLLIFSRKQVMQFRHLDINETLRGSIEMLERLVGEQVRIQFRSDHLLKTIHADSGMMEQIAMNLAVNARDAMPEGGTLTITTSMAAIQRPPTPMDPEPRDGDFVCLTFEDTGMGMDTQILSRIFEPFFTTKPAGKGTGLGLSTVFGIVRQHHGWLEVESRPGQGTCFRIYLPGTEGEADKKETFSETNPASGRETILVAEDEEALLEMVVMALKCQGYNVLSANSAKEALEIWQRARGRIDLLMTDMIMPGGITGNDLAERLTSQSRSLKVIYTSGYSPEMAGKDASLFATRNFLPKPYSINKLAQFVRECLDAPAKLN